MFNAEENKSFQFFRLPPEVFADLYTLGSSNIAGELMTFKSEHSRLLLSLGCFSFIFRKSIYIYFQAATQREKRMAQPSLSASRLF